MKTLKRILEGILSINVDNLDFTIEYVRKQLRNYLQDYSEKSLKELETEIRDISDNIYNWGLMSGHKPKKSFKWPKDLTIENSNSIILINRQNDKTPAIIINDGKSLIIYPFNKQNRYKTIPTRILNAKQGQLSVTTLDSNYTEPILTKSNYEVISLQGKKLL